MGSLLLFGLAAILCASDEDDNKKYKRRKDKRVLRNRTTNDWIKSGCKSWTFWD